jgi:hypothetical protein
MLCDGRTAAADVDVVALSLLVGRMLVAIEKEKDGHAAREDTQTHRRYIRLESLEVVLITTPARLPETPD